MKTKRVMSILVLSLAIVQAALILVSWLVAAAMPEMPVRSLLSSEGIRWLFASFTQNLLTPYLIWILMGSMAYGAVLRSGITAVRSPLSYRQRFALRLVLIEMVVAVFVMLLLTAVPHAVLLSATGQLFPSSFSDSIVIVLCVVVMIAAVTYGLLTGILKELTSVVDSLVYGIGRAGALWLIYVLGVEFIASCRFVLGLVS